MEFESSHYIAEHNRFGKPFPLEIKPHLLTLQQVMHQAGLPILIGETDFLSQVTIGFPESSQNRKTIERVLSAVMESDAWNGVRESTDLRVKQKTLDFLIDARKRHGMESNPYKRQRNYLGPRLSPPKLDQEKLREVIKKAIE